MTYIYSGKHQVILRNKLESKKLFIEYFAYFLRSKVRRDKQSAN